MWKWILATVFMITCGFGTSFVTQGFIVGIVGFWASLAAVGFAWLYLLITALYYLEATLSRPFGANIFSITRFYFGSFWGWLAAALWIIVSLFGLSFIFKLASSLMMGMLAEYGIHIPSTVIAFTFPLVIGFILYLGYHVIMSVNLILFLLLSFGLWGVYNVGFEHITSEYFKLFKWGYIILIIPVTITAVYYQMLIPTLATFLDNQFKKIRSSIIVGSLISAILFALWAVAVAPISGKIGPENLSQAHLKYFNYEEIIKVPLVGPWMSMIGLVSMTTAALVIGSIAIDVLADLLKYEPSARKGIKRLLLIAFLVLPTFLLNWIPYEYIDIPVVILLNLTWLFMSGLLPILWVFARRYREQDSPYTVPGGNLVLFITTGVACFVFYLAWIEILYQIAT